MAGHRWIRRIGQPQLRLGPPAPASSVARRPPRRERTPRQSSRVTSSRASSVRSVPPSSAEPRDAIAMGRLRATHPRGAAPSRRGKRARGSLAASGRALALLLELLPDHVREREVHVVPAEQDVVADSDADQIERAVLVDRGDRGEVGRPAADVDDEEHVARPDLFSPASPIASVQA